MWRTKLIYLAVVLLVIVLGLGSRVFADVLPLFISKHFGDALWGSMVYFGFRLVLTKRQLLLSFWLSLLFSYGIEFSQLYQADWINNIRATVLGGLVLGKGFLWIDLLRYTIGITVVFVLDRAISQAYKVKHWR
ncbi:hypothetical protein A8L34_12220 [Bacillus sp. FJAT-27264]|uniref:ribosomal maturation YjgA family protein n=1 Tax=Paenibacillus sp. (strain DSM 101736 / FJAT-27264) TaxID=1850362 RepID=UPI000807F5B4|nr:DUF2809 domain-containing protein [Bacillus sp. FJAT-27264]OBZ14677.1 hypothetical protein A8L34_12220 [Bacillus sp. FJAT-27264]